MPNIPQIYENSISHHWQRNIIPAARKFDEPKTSKNNKRSPQLEGEQWDENLFLSQHQ